MPIQSISPSAWQINNYPNSLDALLQGIQQGMSMGMQAQQNRTGLKQKDLQNSLLANQVKYAPKNSEADLNKSLLQNKLMDIQAQYQPNIYQSDLNKSQLQNQLLGIQAQYQPNIYQSDLAQQQAQTNLTNLDAKYLPVKTLTDLQASMNSANRFGNSYQQAQFLKLMPAAVRDTVIAQNPEAYAALVNDLGNSNGSSQNPQGQAIVSQALNQAISKALQINPEQQQMLQKQGVAQVGNVPNVQSNMPTLPLPQTRPKFQSSPDQIAQLQKAAQMSANQALTTAGTRNQMEGGIQVEDFMNSPAFQSKALNASQYAGALGKGKEFVAKLSQQNPKAYEDYISFMNQDLVLLKNRIKMLDKMGSTDSQREELDNLYQKTMSSLTSNPQQFITQLNNLGQTLSSISKSVQKSASPIFDVKRDNDYVPIGTSRALKKMDDGTFVYTGKFSGQ